MGISKIKLIEKIDAPSELFDIQTGTENFFANGILVHNSNLWFGLDDTGFFTSREGKSPKKARFYSVDDYAMVANYNSFRAAHLALAKMEPTIRKYLKSGDMVEIEVLFGRQPNTVTYGVEGKNFIVILRGVNGTPDERVQNLANGINNKQVTIESTIVSSPDGDELELNEEKLLWEFTKVEPIQDHKIDTAEATKLLAGLKKYIAQKNQVLPELTNQEVAELSLTSVPKNERDEAKAERVKVNAYILDTFKAPIKEHLLNHFVRKIKPFLQDEKLHPSEDIGVEGVVVRDPVTGSQTKIVDKDVFTAINTFNSAVRAEISGLVRTTNQDASIDVRGGAFGQAKIRIAELLGVKDLALSSGAKRFATKFKGIDAQATALAMAKSMNITSLPAVRTKISSILQNTIKEVNDILHSFKQEAGEFKLTLKTGKEIGITPEIMKRTLTAFAETKKDIAELNTKVLQSRASTDLVLALYGRTIEGLFSGEETSVKESYNLIRLISEDGEGGATSSGAVGGSGWGNASQGAPTSSGSSDVTSNAAGGTTAANNIAALPKKLFKGTRMISRRARTFERPKKFPAPKIEGKFSLLRSISEEWAHVSDMKFATDVDDTAQAHNDVEFKQLRNNVNIGDNVSQMDVNRYLNKAHELNDEVDSVAFGMEMDDGSVAKVYVNAGQADEFEKALAALLGSEDDVEEVINKLANKFDIVDVEWPKSVQPDQSAPLDQQAPPEGSENQGSSELDFSINGEGGSDENSSGDVGNETQGNSGEENEPPLEDGEPKGDEESSEEGDESSEEPAEEPSGEERDEFGQIIKKKKKSKKKKEPASDEEPAEEPVPAEESVSFKGTMLSEINAPKSSFANAGLNGIFNMLMAIGFDMNSPRSMNYQAKQLVSKSVPGLVALKQSTVLQKINIAGQALANVMKLSPATTAPNTAPTTPGAPVQTASLNWIGDVIAEEEAASDGRWIIGKMGQFGLLMKAKGMTIKMSDGEAAKLNFGLSKQKTVSVINPHDKRFVFTPIKGGYSVKETGDESKFPNGIFLPDAQVKEIEALFSNEQENNDED